jgi:hypothetical protein
MDAAGKKRIVLQVPATGTARIAFQMTAEKA